MTSPLTHLELDIDARLSDAPRAAAWSSGGRLLVVSADGRTMIDRPDRVSDPIGPDPVAAAWIGEECAVVADGRLGTYSTGRTRANARRYPVTALGAFGATAVAATGDRLVVRRAEAVDDVELSSRVGRVRDLAPITEAIWVVVGERGWAVVDVGLDTLEAMIEFEGCLRVAANYESAAYAITDLSGSVHVARVGDDENTQQLQGYPDRVRHVAWTPRGRHLVVAADDELTWWAVDGSGRVASQPVCAIGHEDPITSLAVAGHPAIVATGDAGGRLCLWSERIVDRPIAAWELDDEVVLIEWDRPGGRIVAGSANGRIATFRVVRGEIA